MEPEMEEKNSIKEKESMDISEPESHRLEASLAPQIKKGPPKEDRSAFVKRHMVHLL
jgi:hypothetical protein